MKLETPITDQNIIENIEYIGRLEGKGQVLIKAIAFSRYEEEAFKKGLYEVAMLRKSLREENNRFAYNYYEAFIVESGVDK